MVGRIATRSAAKTGELAGVATDGTADTLKIDVAPTDEHGIRWHTHEDTPAVPYVQDGVQSVGLSDPRPAYTSGALSPVSALSRPVERRLLRLFLDLVLAVAPGAAAAVLVTFVLAALADHASHYSPRTLFGLRWRA
ncbi:hypothetical protein GCM10022419_018110 [Nonomuraea rosea]|uniref:RDD family protein n=1 Tax=Nonomuraea rosea TaxID=638574 RepID=A0ABP6VPX8_9ACTN